jgi:hypothetical protein
MMPGPPRVEGLHALEWDLEIERSNTALFLPPAHALLRRLPMPVELLPAAAHKARLACDTSKARIIFLVLLWRMFRLIDSFL